ncbi:MAG TPA: PAS domain S-box protein [Verrucomicrobiota bacterium]|nr:PAS domain S-box protein [Verrucomicrobiota bacterium]
MEIDEVSLEHVAQGADADFEGHFVEYLERRLVSRPVDVVVPFGAPAAQFVAQYRMRLFTRTPILFAAVEPRTLSSNALRTNATLVTQQIHLEHLIEDVLQLQPDTTNVVVALGASPIERFWAGECRREWQVFTNRLSFTWLDTFSVQQMTERVRALPQHSFIVYCMVLVDAAQVPQEKDEPLRMIRAAANAPIYAHFRSHFGQGIVGGRLYDESRVGAEVAKVAIRILHGEKTETLPPLILDSSQPVYDWRELARWGISAERLPEGSLIEYREPELWLKYRGRLMGGAAFLCLQTALITGLLVNRARRREAEAVATLIANLSTKFVHLPSGDVDREIENAQRSICACLSLDLSSLWQWSMTDPGDLVLTHLYRQVEGPPVPESMSARQYFPWALQEVRAGRRVVLASVDQAPAEAARDVEVYRHFGVRASLTVPLSAGGGPVLGALSFNTVRKERDWPEAVVNRLQLVAQIFANALARKRADQELQRSEERFRSIALNLPGAVFQFYARDNGQRGLYYVAGHARDVFGLDVEPLDTFFERFTACVVPEDRQQWLDSIEEAIASVRPWETEARFVTPDGKELYIRGFSQPRRLDNEVLFVGVMRDITHQKRLDLALAASDSRYRTLFNSSPLGVLVIGPDGCVLDANPAQARLYGYSAPEQLVGLPVPLLFREKDREQARRALTSLLGGEEASEQVATAVRRDGSEFTVEVTSAPLRGPRREIQGVLYLTRDVTAARNAQEALRHLSARLIQAQEEERSRLARELHDDITQRLARLAIDVGRGEAGRSATSRNETVRSVRDELIRLSEDVHALSYRLHPSILEDLGLAAALKAEAERLGRQGAVRIDVEVLDLQESVPPEVALCLFRVAQEALRNAARHAGARAIELSVCGWDGGLQLAVHDDGCGFDPMLQRERPSLGHASMRERVHLLGGELDIESAPGQGTTILAWVPLGEKAGDQRPRGSSV